MVIGLIGAMNVETELIMNKFEDVTVDQAIGMTFYSGELFNKKVVLVTSSIGKVNAAICAQYIIDKYNVSTIINTGIAGSLKDDIEINTTIISNKLTYHDVRRIQMIESLPNTEFLQTDEYLQTLASKKSVELSINHIIGDYVTGDSFVNSKEESDKIKFKYDADCVDMESAAIAHVCHLNMIPFLAIKSISDNADDKTDEVLEINRESVAKKSAKLVLEILKDI